MGLPNSSDVNASAFGLIPIVIWKEVKPSPLPDREFAIFKRGWTVFLFEFRCGGETRTNCKWGLPVNCDPVYILLGLTTGINSGQ